jgi:hypothetical protein
MKQGMDWPFQGKASPLTMITDFGFTQKQTLSQRFKDNQFIWEMILRHVDTG